MEHVRQFSVNPDVRGLAYCHGFRLSSNQRRTWFRLYALALEEFSNNEVLVEEVVRLAVGLSCLNDQALVRLWVAV